MFQHHHDRDWEHNKLDPLERRNSRRGMGIRPIKLRKTDRWKQYQTRRYHQAKFGGLGGVWKIASSRKFEQHQRQWLSES
jgi:hypothetical protein